MRRLWCVALLALGLAVAAPARADSTASISGTVTAAVTGAPLAGVIVQAFEPFEPTPVASATSDAGGGYQLTGLDAGEYLVCVDATGSTHSDPRDIGYQSRCYLDTPYSPDPFVPPTSHEHVTVAAGGAATGIDVALPAAAAITGHVRDASGAPVSGVGVYVFANPPGGMGRTEGYTTTAANGTYRVTMLPATPSGYIVCFKTFRTTATAPAGYLPECYRNRPWAGSGYFPDGMTPAAAVAGTVTRGIDAALQPAAGISGRVVDARDGTPVEGITVWLVDRAGSNFTSIAAVTDADGRYAITGLAPSDGAQRVCFGVTDGTRYLQAPTGYAGQCADGVPWAGRGPAPGGLTPVPLQSGSFSTVDAALRPGGELTGTVRDPSGTPLRSATLILIRADGTYVVGFGPNTAGHYVLRGLPAGKKYLLCVRYAGAGECYRHAAWSPTDPPPATATRFDFAAGQVRTIPFVLDPA